MEFVAPDLFYALAKHKHLQQLNGFETNKFSPWLPY